MVPLAVRLRLPRGARLDRRRDGRSPGEPVGHARRRRAQPPARTTAVKHRNIVGEYRKANLYTAHIARRLRPGRAVHRRARAGDDRAHRREHGARRRRSATASFAAFMLYLTRAVRADPAARAALQHVPAGPGRRRSSCRDLFATNPTVREKPDARELPPIEGEITLENVTFGYKPDGAGARARRPHASRAGETFALVGPTGAGKSTIAKLLTRFYDPTRRHGARRRPRRPRRHPRTRCAASSASCPRSRSCSPAASATTSRSPRPEATREDVLAACDAVGILDLIDAAARRASTRPCHERGVTLSSGERQLIALGPRVPGGTARADPRRGDVEPRPRDRVARRTRPRRVARRPHRGPHRPPAQHRDAGRSDRAWSRTASSRRSVRTPT